MANVNELKKEIIETGSLIYEKGYNVSIDGNISVRMEDGNLLLTATGSRLGFLTEDDIVITDIEGNLLEGSRRATSEKILHTNIYKERNDVNAVIHVHAPNCVALSMLDVDIEHNMYATMAPIPITEFALPSTEESWLRIKPYVKDYNWAILQRHGIVAYESTLLSAFLRLEGMEHFAKMFMLAKAAGEPTPLSEENKTKLLRSWGMLK